MSCVRFWSPKAPRKKGKGGASTQCSRCVRTGARGARRRLAPEQPPPTFSRWRLVLNELRHHHGEPQLQSGFRLVPFLEQLVTEHPANVRHGEPADQAGQQHAGAHRLGHRRRLHQELQLPVFSGFLGRERKKKKKTQEKTKGSGLRPG